MKECWKPKFGECCCECANRHNDYSHPETDGKSILTIRGYICSTGELGNFSGWMEHGDCEIFTPRPERPEDKGAAYVWDRLYSSSK